MSENNRKKQHTDLECVQIGFANGVAPGFPLTEKEKWSMVDEAEEAYGKFLDALGVDWRNDPNSEDTPRRVAKAYVFDYLQVDTMQCQILLHFQVMDMMVS
jgi:GTP cyclohydrolase IA